MYRMFKRIIFKISVTACLVTGCFNSYEKETSAASSVAKQIKAAKSEIAITEYSDTDNRNRKTITLTFDKFTDLPENHSKEKIASTAALLYLNQFEKSEHKNYDEIKIILQDPQLKFEKGYSIQDLSSVELLFGIIQEFINGSNGDNFNQIKKTVDEGFIPDSTLRGATVFISEIDSLYGKVNHINFGGFKFDKLEQNNEPVLVSWVQTNHVNTTTDFKFIISRASKKIIYIGVNETD